MTLMAVLVTLSAFAVWQATEASNEADGLASDGRVSQAQIQAWNSQLQTYVDHDARVLARYCEEYIAHEAAKYQLFGKEPNVSDVVPSQVALESVSSQALGGVPVNACGAEVEQDSPQTAYEPVAWAASAMPPYPSADSDADSRLSRLTGMERGLMLAGCMFSLALFGLIGVDVLGDRRQRPRRLLGPAARRAQGSALVMSSAVALIGLVLLARYGRLLVVMGAVVVIAGTVGVLAWGSRSGRQLAPQVVGERPHWWAEIVGALTLVAFSAAALGLSTTVGEERSERALAGEQRSVAASLAQQGHQVAMRDLGHASEIAVLDGRLAAANMVNDTELQDATDAVREVRETFLRDLEATAQTPLDAQLNSVAEACPAERSGPSDARTILSRLREDPAAARRHIYAMQEPALACNIAADRTGLRADVWSSRSSNFTVALVLLGLSGFMLALAADSGRSRRMSTRLLITGAVGALVGTFVGLGVPVGMLVAGGEPSAKEEEDFARGVAAGMVHGCDATAFEDSLDRIDSYGPASFAKALATACEHGAIGLPGVLTSEIKQERALSQFTADLTRAVDLGPATAVTEGNLGWAHILTGLGLLERESKGELSMGLTGLGLRQRDAQDELLKGITLTQEAIRDLETDPNSVGTLVHTGRFNAALAEGAMGDSDAAAARYRHAVECLDPKTRCAGGGIANASHRLEPVLWALADLELLPDGPDTDRLRAVVLSAMTGGNGSTSQDETSHPLVNGELDIFPQELQVSSDGTAQPVSIVWYYRPTELVAWGVLEIASRTTLPTGDHMNHPVLAKMVLPDGYYRADVYSAGRRVLALTEERKDALVVRRESMSELRMSAVVPEDWIVRTHEAGINWVAGPPDDETAGVWLHRAEAVVPTDSIDRDLDGRLRDWLMETLDAEIVNAPHTVTDKYFVGLDHGRVWETDTPGLKAAIGISPYISDAYCGGSVFMAAVLGPSLEEDLILEVFDSVVVDGQLPQLQNPSDVETADYALHVPDGWVATTRPVGAAEPNEFLARECWTGANVLLSMDNAEGETVSGSVKATLDALAVTDDFPGFVLQAERRGVDVAGGSDAVELEYTWTPPQPGPVRQRQLHATNGTQIITMTSTVWDDGEDLAWWQEATDVFFSTLTMTPTSGPGQ